MKCNENTLPFPLSIIKEEKETVSKEQRKNIYGEALSTRQSTTARQFFLLLDVHFTLLYT